jgi:hypothetical protein
MEKLYDSFPLDNPFDRCSAARFSDELEEQTWKAPIIKRLRLGFA